VKRSMAVASYFGRPDWLNVQVEWNGEIGTPLPSLTITSRSRRSLE
jgi:hypothetical protein